MFGGERRCALLSAQECRGERGIWPLSRMRDFFRAASSTDFNVFCIFKGLRTGGFDCVTRELNNHGFLPHRVCWVLWWIVFSREWPPVPVKQSNNNDHNNDHEHPRYKPVMPIQSMCWCYWTILSTDQFSHRKSKNTCQSMGFTNTSAIWSRFGFGRSFCSHKQMARTVKCSLLGISVHGGSTSPKIVLEMPIYSGLINHQQPPYTRGLWTIGVGPSLGG